MFVICFISQWMERTKHGLFVFPPKKTLIWRRHCSIDQSCCSMTSKQFLESSSGMKFVYPSVRLANQKQGAFVSVRYTNQIALFPFVCCFCFVRAFSFQSHTKIALSKALNCRLPVVPSFFLRDSRASETRACVKTPPREKRQHCVSPSRVG